MNSLRDAAQAALEALEAMQSYAAAERKGLRICDEAIDALRAALAQQAEPVEPVATITECEACFTPDVCQLRGTCDYYTASQMRIAAPPQQAEPVASLNAWAADRLARHGIQACLYPQCVGGQSGTVCHKHCPTPCPDCRGVGYDASGQLCACQQNPSF